MAKVWVQAWTAKVAGLENLRALVPMLVEVREKDWELVPSVLVKESPLVQVSGMDLARAEEMLEVLEPWKD